MTNKIKPVSDETAQFFMNEVVYCRELGYIYRLLGVHGCKLNNSLEEDAPAFAAFCRAVADKLDPPAYNPVARIFEREFAKKCFHEGYHYGLSQATIEYIQADMKPQLKTGESEKILKEKGLLND